MYSKCDLAMYFQVRCSTIDHWITQGRFIGIPKEAKIVQDIGPHVKWVSLDGTTVTIKDIVERYHANPHQPPDLSLEEERTELLFEINTLENKYGGHIHDLSSQNELSHEEEQDFGAWFHFSTMLKKLECRRHHMKNEPL